MGGKKAQSCFSKGNLAHCWRQTVCKGFKWWPWYFLDLRVSTDVFVTFPAHLCSWDDGLPKRASGD